MPLQFLHNQTQFLFTIVLEARTPPGQIASLPASIQLLEIT
jgi:hypothetical protein